MTQEGYTVDEMLSSLEVNGEFGDRSWKVRIFNSVTLRSGDFCDEELLTLALMPNINLNPMLSTRTARTLFDVDAFTLRAEDLKFLANQFMPG